MLIVSKALIRVAFSKLQYNRDYHGFMEVSVMFILGHIAQPYLAMNYLAGCLLCLSDMIVCEVVNYDLCHELALPGNKARKAYEVSNQIMWTLCSFDNDAPMAVKHYCQVAYFNYLYLNFEKMDCLTLTVIVWSWRLFVPICEVSSRGGWGCLRGQRSDSTGIQTTAWRET